MSLHRNHSRALRATLAAALFAVALAPAASAIQIGIGSDNALDDLGALSGAMSIETEIQLKKLRISVYGGGSVDYEKVVKTIEFQDGPVEVTSFDKRGLLDVNVKTVDDEMLKRLVSGDLSEPVLVESIQVKTLNLAANDGTLRLDVVGSSNPVPEPGAALLFGAGLAAVAIRTRR